MKPFVITEGKTDWKHLKAALESLKKAPPFEQVEIDFLEYEDETQMGDMELLKMCRTYSKAPRDRPIIFLFDRDNASLLTRVLGPEGQHKEWGNNVFSFALPIPGHRRDHPEICIELYYRDDEIMRVDSQGRRLFLSTEFHPRSGRHHTEDLHCMELNKLRRSIVAIVDDQVFNRDSDNVALPKAAFADYVLKRVIPFDDLGFSEFARVFEIISIIADSGSGELDTTARPAVESAIHDFSPEASDLEATKGRSWELPRCQRIFPATAKAKGSYYAMTLEGQNARTIESVLRSFGVPARVAEISKGPVFTRYILNLREVDYYADRVSYVRPEEIGALVDDLTAAVASAHPIQIQFPVPNRRYGNLGILIKNPQREVVHLGHILTSSTSKTSSMTSIALGKHVDGDVATSDLVSFPHLLIAGRVSSGKSVCVDSILVSLLIKNTPASLRMILVDCTEAEFAHYAGVPHVLNPTVTRKEVFLSMLQWLEREIKDRSLKLSEKGLGNIVDFNASAESETTLPLLLILINELPELMKPYSRATMQRLVRLLRVSSGLGIHSVIVTRNPRSKAVVDLLRDCPMTRAVFTTSSREDSIAILGDAGAEELLGLGDMLLVGPGASAPSRIQGSYVSSEEVDRLVAYWQWASTHDLADEAN